jgi:sn-glycerol 3-phosphate transport system permease protein
VKPRTGIPETLGAWLLGLAWILPLIWAIWAAFHAGTAATSFSPLAPLTLRNFVQAWKAAPLARGIFNTTVVITIALVSQFLLCTPAAFAFARLSFPGRDALFALVLVQLLVSPDILMVENYRTTAAFGLVDSLLGIALPYLGSAFGIFLLRQTFRQVPRELDEAARLEGLGPVRRLWQVYVPLARPTYVAYGLVLVSFHWNNFLWPLIVTNSVATRPLTVTLAMFSTPDQGLDWPVITAATLLSVAPLLVAFLIFQRQFMQNFIRAGIR